MPSVYFIQHIQDEFQTFLINLCANVEYRIQENFAIVKITRRSTMREAKT